MCVYVVIAKWRVACPPVGVWCMCGSCNVVGLQSMQCKERGYAIMETNSPFSINPPIATPTGDYESMIATAVYRWCSDTYLFMTRMMYST